MDPDEREPAAARSSEHEPLPAVPGRDETTTERLDRNFGALLQEVRVAETGTQVFLGFLLILPFQDRFGQLDDLARGIYLALVAIAALALGLAFGPVAVHRMLFRRGRMDVVVGSSDVLTRIVIALLMLLVPGTALFIFDVLLGIAVGLAAGGALIAIEAIVLVLALRRARSEESRELAGDEAARGGSARG